MSCCFFLYVYFLFFFFFFFSSRRRHTRLVSDWSSDVCSSDLNPLEPARGDFLIHGAEGRTRVQGHPRRDDDETRIAGESDSRPGLRALPDPKGEPDRETGRRLGPGHEDAE